MIFRNIDGKPQFWCDKEEIHRLPNNMSPLTVAHVGNGDDVIDYVLDSTGTWVPKEGK